MSGSWRLAARLARRETRRRPGRALLVVLLIAVPVFALTVADVLVNTQHSDSGSFARRFGSADLAIGIGGEPVGAGSGSGFGQTVIARAVNPDGTFVGPDLTTADQQARAARSVVLPRGSDSVEYSSAELALDPAGGRGERFVSVLNAAGDRLDLAGLRLLRGHAPRAGEMAVSGRVADWLGLEVGDTATFTRPVFSARVSGIVGVPADLTAPVIDAPSFNFGAVGAAATLSRQVVIDLPSRVSPHAVVREFEQADQFLTVERPSTGRPALAAPVRVWSWVAAALLLAMVSVIIAAAFATTARRQLVTIGQLSASGAGGRFLRRMLTLQGTLTGVLGSAFGVGSALIALTVWKHTVARLYNHDLGPYRLTSDLLAVFLTAVVAATIAARFPARDASRVPVLSALAGRRPLPPVPPLRWLKALILFLTGVGLVFFVAQQSREKVSMGPTVTAAIAIVGGLFVIVAAAFATPIVVTLAARFSRSLGASSRLAARSLVRVRSRSAAIVTSIAIAGMTAVALATALLGVWTPQIVTATEFGLPRDVVVVTANGGFGATAISPTDRAALDAGRAAVRRVVPGTRFENVLGASVAVGPSTDGVSPAGAKELGPTAMVLVATPALRQALRWSGELGTELRRSGMAGLAWPGSPPGDVTLDVPTAPGRTSIRAHMVASSLFRPWFLGADVAIVVSPQRAALLHLVTEQVASLGLAPHSLTSGERDTLNRSYRDPYGDVGGSVFAIQTGYSLDDVWTGIWNPFVLERSAAEFALVMTLLVVAIGLLLGASESRDERDVLDALGARPRTERRIGAIKAWVLAFAGALLAVPAGFVPIAVVFRALQRHTDTGGLLSRVSGSTASYPSIHFPTTTAVGVLVVIPILAAVGTWAVTWIAQRTRPVLRNAGFGVD